MSQVWKDIVKVCKESGRLGLMLEKGFQWEVGDGGRVVFWEDKIWNFGLPIIGYGIVSGDEIVLEELVMRKKSLGR
ncbi:hypothetical protein SLEP1_g7628 [Rubroshorea leprosula]|uniref:Uncharacterized protein n=1 Tax=Rubroshorea leprosula TaxID=152421 RepID=A0AAV5I8U6_9ROSI|nr:hypothetical protein SLEP1_g7628 [Rubroshorea leprosula]